MSPESKTLTTRPLNNLVIVKSISMFFVQVNHPSAIGLVFLSDTSHFYLSITCVAKLLLNHLGSGTKIM